MALRNIRIDGDDVLRKNTREVKEINDRIKDLIKDMFDTMYHADGVGLAAPQVGILKKIVTIDVGEGKYAMINPEIIEKEGEVIDIEGCLSIPNFRATVKRPEKVKVKFTDIDGNIQEVAAEGLFARCICHELDHLQGVLFKDKYIEEVDNTGAETDEEA